jgi:hypothetical protein
VALDPAAIFVGAVPTIDKPAPEIVAEEIFAASVPVFVRATDWLVLVPSVILPKVMLVGFAESVPVPSPDPEPPELPEPELPVPLAPPFTTPAQLDSPIESTTRATVPTRVARARITRGPVFAV